MAKVCHPNHCTIMVHTNTNENHSHYPGGWLHQGSGLLERGQGPLGEIGGLLEIIYIPSITRTELAGSP